MKYLLNDSDPLLLPYIILFAPIVMLLASHECMTAIIWAMILRLSTYNLEHGLR